MMDKYGKILINNASKLDAIIATSGEITRLATVIVDEHSRGATIALLKRISEAVDNEKYKIEIKRAAQAVNTSLIEFYGYSTIQSICQPTRDVDQDRRTLEELLDELNNLTGLEKVKSNVQDLILYQKVQQLRREKNLHTTKSTLHLAFTGNPGTGKTTVARIVGRIYKRIGLLSKGHFVEVSRTDLIAGYQGQTALKVKKVIEQAKGGVLFIDEAYSITENEHSDSYGRECLTELTKALEDYRDDLVVIVAGYTEPMNKFFESNPGLKSRFNTFIEFDDYSSAELVTILLSICQSNDYILDDEAKEKIHLYFEKQISLKDENFANARLARNLYDDLIIYHARRVIKVDNPSSKDLSTIRVEDCKFDCNEVEEN
ncbi:AAA family ATPase [Streptococcus ruminantium]|uniref:AAA family ATPase n=1 Tax=Streptococcus ruminantium TaxID=1917441 RepID=UPI00350E4F5B